MAEGNSATAPTDYRLARQELVLRGAIVVLVGAFHNYLEDLLDEWSDTLGRDFKSLPSVGKRYVVLQVQAHLGEALFQRPDEQSRDETARKKLVKAVEECAEWIDDPSTLSASAKRRSIEGFFTDQVGVNAVIHTLNQFRDDGVEFPSWLKDQHPSHADYFDRLNSAIKLRNEVAHGELNIRVTVEDFRRHRATITQLVRKSEQFVSGALKSPNP